MGKVRPGGTEISPEIWEWVWDTLEEISDEVGTEKNGKYLLVYEGWSGLCVSEAFDSTKSDEENEDTYYRFAEEQSDEIIEEQIKKYEAYYSLIDCSHESIGLYGVTWALLKE